MACKICLIDVTNRDGVQTSRLSLAKIEKTMINYLLNKAGISYSEFGFPMTLHETNYLNGNIALAEQGVLSPIKLSGWMRAITSDVEESLKLVPKLKFANLSMSTSRQMIEHKFKGKGLTIKDMTKKMTEAVDMGYQLGLKEIGVNAEDASRTDINDLIDFAKAAKEHGAVRFRYCDTLGYDTPFSIYSRIKRIAEEVQIDVEPHCHNDLGMSVANSVAGAKAAIDSGVNAFINVTVNGIGERAGNADLTSVILALKFAAEIDHSKYQLDQKIDLKKTWELANYAAEAFKVPIPITAPGLGANAFAHESGIHADGVLKDSKNYELYDEEAIGRGIPLINPTGRIITVGEYSGLSGFKHVCEHQNIIFADDKTARDIMEIARFANVTTQKPLTKEELRFICAYPDIVKKIISLNAADL